MAYPDEISAALIKLLLPLMPFMQIVSGLLLGMTIYKVFRNGHKLFSVLRDGEARKYIISGLVAIEVAVLYALVASHKPTVFVTSVVHMGLWILSLGLIRAFGDFGGDRDGERKE